jgi:hypothetical protein
MGVDEILVSREKISSWTARIAAAVDRQEARSLAALVKPAALLAAVSGRLDLVESWLQHIPIDVIERDPQLLYWSGTTALMKRPADAQDYLVRAFEMLQRRPKGSWVLLAWAGVVDAMFFQYRDLRELDPWIEWMTPVRESVVDRLPRLPRTLVVSSMLFALAFRQPNHPRIAVWRERAERLVELDPTSDLGARLTAGLITDYTWRGNLAAADIAWKRFSARESRTPLSPLAAVIKHLNEATLCLHEGHFEQCRRAVEKGLSAAAEHDIHLWDSILHCHAISASCSLDDTTQARVHIAAVEQLYAEGITVDEAYYRGMLFWEAFTEGDHVGALSRCTSALELADAKGVPYLQAACRIGTALAFFEAGHEERGSTLLDEGLAIGREIGNPLLAWVGGLFRAHMEYANGNLNAADAALEKAMRLGRDHSLAHIFFWPRRIVARLIDRALERNYSTDYARFLIARHAFAPGTLPTRSDQWPFEVRIYTFGEPRIEYADGRVEPLSVQFQRQIELLAALIGKEGKPTPVYIVAGDVYQTDDVEVIGSIKRVLHSFRERLGQIVIQRNSSLSLDFSKVWIDACGFQRLCRETCSATEIEAWLNQYYHGHFLNKVENSQIVCSIRRRLHNQVERSIRDAYALRVRQNDDALRQFEARWQDLFPSVCETTRTH